MSAPSKTMLPPVGSCSRVTSRPVVVLPQPDSPTRPRVSPAAAPRSRSRPRPGRAHAAPPKTTPRRDGEVPSQAGDGEQVVGQRLHLAQRSGGSLAGVVAGVGGRSRHAGLFGPGRAASCLREPDRVCAAGSWSRSPAVRWQAVDVPVRCRAPAAARAGSVRQRSAGHLRADRRSAGGTGSPAGTLIRLGGVPGMGRSRSTRSPSSRGMEPSRPQV